SLMEPDCASSRPAIKPAPAESGGRRRRPRSSASRIRPDPVGFPGGRTVMITVQSLVLALDLGGTFVFAISGALAAVNRRLDVFGILVLAFVAGNFGGITRDLLIGAVPPAALGDARYLLVSVAAGLVVFFLYAGVDRLRSPVLLFDAAGLSVFAVAGAQKALAFGLSPLMAALLGMLTGIGGGMTRDLLLTEIPQVLRSDLYAVAALAG